MCFSSLSFLFREFQKYGKSAYTFRDSIRDVNDLLLSAFRTKRSGKFNPSLFSRKDLSATGHVFALARVFHSSLSSESSTMIEFFIALTLPDSGNVSGFALRRLAFLSVVREIVDLTLTFLSSLVKNDRVSLQKSIQLIDNVTSLFAQ